jgi:hypothetical protein
MATGNQTNNRQQKRSKGLTQQQMRNLLSRRVVLGLSRQVEEELMQTWEIFRQVY